MVTVHLGRALFLHNTYRGLDKKPALDSAIFFQKFCIVMIGCSSMCG